MNDNELSTLLRQAKAQSPKPASDLAARTIEAYRERFPRLSFFRRHWRLAAAAAAALIVICAVGTRTSTGSPLPPEYDRPGIVASSSMQSRAGWRVDYSTVVRPFSPGPHTATFTGSSIDESNGTRPIVFHRYLGDVAAKTWYGYDIVLHTNGMSGKVTFRPLSVKPADLPEEFRAAGSRILEVRELPTRSFDTGENIAVTLLTNPSTNQQVIDYVHVDTSFFNVVHHILGNIITAIHSHLQPHE
jgi:hypothetical protein